MQSLSCLQVCQEHEIPYLVIRTISDKADHSAEVDFPRFIEEVASQYSAGIVAEYLSPSM